jgi:hypothetical protein
VKVVNSMRKTQFAICVAALTATCSRSPKPAAKIIWQANPEWVETRFGGWCPFGGDA